MIKSETIKIKKIDNFDNLYIEKELSKFYKSIVRWAIVNIDNDITVCVSYNSEHQI